MEVVKMRDLSTSVHWLIYQGKSNNRIYSSPYILTVLLYHKWLVCIVFLGFWCCDKHHDGEHPGVERDYFILKLSGHTHHWQNRGEELGQQLKQRPWRCGSYWLLPLAWTACFLIKHRTTCQRCATQRELSPLTSVITGGDSPKSSLQTSLKEVVSQLRFPPCRCFQLVSRWQEYQPLYTSFPLRFLIALWIRDYCGWCSVFRKANEFVPKRTDSQKKRNSSWGLTLIFVLLMHFSWASREELKIAEDSISNVSD